MPSLLQKFDPAKSHWRFVKVAFDVSAPHPAYRHVLLALARYADKQGVCYPSHDRLLDDTGYGTKTTIVNALKHWKSVGVLNWKKGWGNAHGRRSNVYQFDYNAMLSLASMKKHSRSDEQPLADNEKPLSTDEQPPGGIGTTTRPNTKVLEVEVPKNKNNPVSEGDAGRLSRTETAEQDHSPPEAYSGEQPQCGSSSEKPQGVLSSPVHEVNAAHAIPTQLMDGVAWDREYGAWGARRDIGRPTTDAERTQISALNKNKVKPHQIQGVQ
jgi:hypothetical protein